MDHRPLHDGAVAPPRGHEPPIVVVASGDGRDFLRREAHARDVRGVRLDFLHRGRLARDARPAEHAHAPEIVAGGDDGFRRGVAVV